MDPPLASGVVFARFPPAYGYAIIYTLGPHNNMTQAKRDSDDIAYSQ